MLHEEYEVVVVGAGQAGLGVSYYLRQSGRNHVVFERGQIGESWLSGRWDSFQLNTPNFMNALPGYPYLGQEPDGFWTPAELTAYFRSYIDRFNLPVRTGVTVTSVERSGKVDCPFRVRIRPAWQGEDEILTRAVVIAAGNQHLPKFPPCHTHLPSWVTHLHSAAYRRPGDLPPGAVVVVGSGQSGCQITEDLLEAGRKVYLCTSKVGRAPRRYRGRDMLEWLTELRFFEVSYASLEDKSVALAPQPQVSGVGRFGHSVSLQYLASKGAVILGRLLDVQDGDLLLGDDAADNVRFADEFSRRMKEEVDAYIQRVGKTLPPLEEDPADAPDLEAACAYSLPRLSLKQAGISTIIWATGYTADFSWIHLPVFDGSGQLVHRSGISPVAGLYFLGFPWLNSRKSGLIYGIEDDAFRIAEVIKDHLKEQSQISP